MRGSRYLVGLALALTACGGDGTPGAAPTTTPPTTPPTTVAPTTAEPDESLDEPRLLVQLALAQAVLAQEAHRVEASAYTTNVDDLVEAGYEPEAGVTVTVLSADADRYCMKAAGGGVTLYFETGSQGATDKPCS